MAPRCIPEWPLHESEAERLVWTQLRNELPNSAYLIANRRFLDEQGRRAECDLIVAWPGVGIINIEVKGGRVHRSDEGKWISINGQGEARRIDPDIQINHQHDQVSSYIERHWSRGKPKFASMVVMPFSEVPADLDPPELPRVRMLDRGELPEIVDRIRSICYGSLHQITSSEYCKAFVETLTAGRDPKLEFITERSEREALIQEWTANQHYVLDLIEHQPAFAVLGPAGSGKTYLALEQTRRLSAKGKQVALVCLSHGLSRYLKRIVASWKPNEQPAFVGMLHELAADVWRVRPPANPDDHWYAVDSANQAFARLREGKGLQLFDGFVIDEAQDMTSEWWKVIHAATRLTDGAPTLCVFGDVDQRIFRGTDPSQLSLFSLVLKRNLRNTAPIAELVGHFPKHRPQHTGLLGPKVRFIQCEPTEAVKVADDLIDLLADEGWAPQEIALLTTNERHPVHDERAVMNKEAYWADFWENQDVFYGRVQNFKGLERPVVILAVDGWMDPSRAREALYVGMSRPRDLLIVCGDLEMIRKAGGEAVARELLTASVDLAAEPDDAE